MAFGLAPQMAALVMILSAALQCTHSQEDRFGGARAPASQKTVEEGIRLLKAEFPDAQILTDSSGARVRRITGLPADRTTDTTPQQIALSILRKQPVAAALGLSPDLRELCPPDVRKDPQLVNYAVVRMQQCIKNVKVIGAELVMNVRIEPSPGIDMLTSSLSTGAPADLETKITAELAAASAAAAFEKVMGRRGSSTSQSRESRPSQPELAVFDPVLFGLSGPARLCWLVRVGSLAFLIDALDGSVRHQYIETRQGSPV